MPAVCHVQVQPNASENNSWQTQFLVRVETGTPLFQVVILLEDMNECSVTVLLENAGV